MNLTDAPRRAANIEQTDLRDGAVVFDTSTQVAHHFNPTAMLIWELIDGRPISSIIDEVVSILELERKQVESWVVGMIENLQEQCLVQ